jgi:arginase
VRADPAGCAAPAAAVLTAAADGVVVHFDVDAVDSADLPLANFLHYGLGVPLAAAAGVLPVFYRMPRLLAAVFTEVNPSYEPSGAALARYVEATAGALAAALAGPRA